MAGGKKNPKGGTSGGASKPPKVQNVRPGKVTSVKESGKKGGNKRQN